MNSIINKYINQIKNPVNTKNMTFSETTSHLIMLCGKENGEEKNNRDFLLEYAAKHLKQYKFFLIEQFLNVCSLQSTDDLLTMENTLAEYSDCIIIILESNGAVAELGAFANRKDLCKIILTINDSKYSEKESFINLGPIKFLNNQSKFKPMIETDLERISTCIESVEERLKVIEKKYRRRIEEPLSTLIRDNKKSRLYLLHDIIRLFQPINRKEIEYIFDNIIENRKFELTHEIELLLTLILIKEDNKYLTTLDTAYFYSFDGFSINDFRVMIFEDYKKNDCKRLEIYQ